MLCYFTIRHCEFSINFAKYGGAINVCPNCELNIYDCKFDENLSVNEGGAINMDNNSTANILNSIFIKNEAIIEAEDNSDGGAICNESSYLDISNSTFYYNIADRGATISSLEHSPFGPATTIIKNSILWGHSPDQSYPYQIYTETGSTSTVSYSDVIMEQGIIYSGISNLNIDPNFVDPDLDDLHLKSQAGHWTPGGFFVPDPSNSPCIDAGDPSSPYYKERWPNGEIVNMGAYGHTSQASKSPALEEKNDVALLSVPNEEEGIINYIIYPNPFTYYIEIQFTLIQTAQVNIRIFNAMGKHVNSLTSGIKYSGKHSVIWNGTDNSGNSVPLGIYYCILSHNNVNKVRKMIYIR